MQGHPLKKTHTMNSLPLNALISDVFHRQDLNALEKEHLTRRLLEELLPGLESGLFSMIELDPVTREATLVTWVKQGILLLFRFLGLETMGPEGLHADKIPLQPFPAEIAAQKKTRVVPGAWVRRGVYLGPQTVVMPSLINIGAAIHDGTMVDMNAVVGSGAYIGKRVHLSAGCVIGGVLEPLASMPTIIEDNVFIGASVTVLEGVRIGQGSILAPGVIVTQGTRIFCAQTQVFLPKGRIPDGSLVVPGSYLCQKTGLNIACAVMTKTVSAETREKVALNDLLRHTEEVA